jgi:hypothetical protein
VTFTTGDYTPIVVLAIAGATVAVALIGLAWRRLTAVPRVISGVLLLVNVWTLADAGARRLPALLGW